MVPRPAILLLETRQSAWDARSLQKCHRNVGSVRRMSARLYGLFTLRLLARFAGAPDAERAEEEMLVGEGLTLALLTPRLNYAGGRLLTVMRRAECLRPQVAATPQ